MFSLAALERQPVHEAITIKTNAMKTSQEKREQAIKTNELLKVCPKEQAKLKRQLRKLGLL